MKTALKDYHDKLRGQLVMQQKEAQANLQPLYAERDSLLKQVQPLEAKLRELQKKIKEAEIPLREAGQDLATIARAEGAKTLTNEGPGKPEQPTEAGVPIGVDSEGKAERVPTPPTPPQVR